MTENPKPVKKPEGTVVSDNQFLEWVQDDTTVRTVQKPEYYEAKMNEQQRKR